MLSVLAHVLFLSVAGYFIVQTYTTKHKQTFTPSAKGPNANTRALEHKVQQKRRSAASAPPAAKRVTVANSTSNFVLPALPAMASMTTPLSPATVSGMGAAGLAPGSLGGGGGGGGAGGGSINFFGVQGGQGLVGTFYDLKQTSSRQPTGMIPKEYGKVVGDFVRGGFNTVSLAKYYRAGKPLYTSQIAIPEIDANQGPAAFHVEKEVQPRMWLVHYKGQVVAPEDGIFHFVGAGDDLLLVGFNNRLVLDGCYFDITDFKPLGRYTGFKFSNPKKGLVKGLSVTVEKGKTYPIDIVIGEQPGGRMCAVLLMEQEGATYQKGAAGIPVLPLFRMGNTPPGSAASLPPHLNDGPVWKSVAAKLTDSIFN